MKMRLMLSTLTLAGGVIAIGQLGASPDLTTSPGPGLSAERGGDFEPVGGPPDVYCLFVSGLSNWSSGGFRAYSVGTTSCNQGGTNLIWNGSTNQHPVIGQAMYRLKEVNGHPRFEQIGQSWLKHGFCALDQTQCGPCSNGTGCPSLAPGCSDPYTSGRNGSQGSAGPKYQVNATTGFFPYPPADPSYSGSVARRLQVPLSDVEAASNPGARYFLEAQYVHYQDCPEDDVVAAGNNASYREVELTANGTASGYIGNTVAQLPALEAWKAIDNNVNISIEPIVGVGTVRVASRVYDNGNGTWDYEYAVHNLDIDAGIGAFQVPIPDGVTLTNIGFNDVDYHSGEPQVGTDWTTTQTGGALTWACQTEAQNPNANAIRWGTQYNFRFTADTPPMPTDAGVDFWKASGPANVAMAIEGPTEGTLGLTFDFPNGLPDLIDPAGGTTIRVVVDTNGDETPAAGTGTLYYRANGGAYTSTPMSQVTPNVYDAIFPDVACNALVEYYFSAESTAGDTRFSPSSAPAVVYSAPAYSSIGIAFEDDFEADQGWTVENLGASSGDWQRGVPVDDPNWDYDPAADGDGSGQCFLTQNEVGNTDVDAGSVRLTSPILDMSGVDVTIEYGYFLRLTNDDGTDQLLVEVSDDGGASWSTLTVHDTDGGLGWRNVVLTESDLVSAGVTPGTNMQVRFTANDGEPQSIVEAGVDGFRIESIVCDPGEDPCPQDVDGDDMVSFTDLLAVLSAWGPCPGGCASDISGDENVGFEDLLAVLAAWGDCP